MEKHYDFALAQKKWIKRWKEENTWHAVADNRKSYSIVIPPPNVTDILHLGHALNNTIQDILIRYNRNKGFNTEWLPGTDHAGIATQVVVEKRLAVQNRTKNDLGRELFVDEVWSWVNDRKDTILKQLEGIGASCDWDRKKFTLDSDLSETVAIVFKKLYDEKYIYRGTYIVNWCPRCHTALSDEEVEYENRNGKLYYLRYPLKDKKEHIIIATTRPETMLGDTGIAINPNDETKQHLIGSTVILPLVNREIPIVADNYVDMEFGTGFVKVTPAHDPNDFEIGKRHGLEEIIIMDENGIINHNGKEYEGLRREDARKKIIDDLDEMGLIERIEDYNNSVGTCYRCHTTIEPYLSEQWFVKMSELAKPALRASVNGDISFYPTRWKGVYDHWLNNIKDWCISRQLWWGHRIPVYYCDDCKEEFVSIKKAVECPKCKSSNIRQDENVLDTWFSSWLWPFSTLGWKDNTEIYKQFYPTNVIVSASEILFFWIARMIIAGLHFTGELPFKDIYIHGTVRDDKGRKMSKSLGNGIDPLEITSEFGADALRFSLLYVAGQGKDPNINKSTFELGRNFANKIWNAVRYILLNEEHISVAETVSPENIFDGWILSKLYELEQSAEKNLNSYRFYDYVRDVYDFFWHDFCDWYLEIIKANSESNRIAIYIINRFISLLNPIMPFITEEINEILGNSEPIHKKSIDNTEFEFKNNIIMMETLKSLITSIRNFTAETGMNNIQIMTNSESEFIYEHLELIKALTKNNELIIIEKKPEKAIPAVFNQGMLFIPSQDIENPEIILDNYRNEQLTLSKQLEKTQNTLNNENFLNKANPVIIEEMRIKANTLKEKINRINVIIDSLK